MLEFCRGCQEKDFGLSRGGSSMLVLTGDNSVYRNGSFSRTVDRTVDPTPKQVRSCSYSLRNNCPQRVSNSSRRNHETSEASPHPHHEIQSLPRRWPERHDSSFGIRL